MLEAAWVEPGYTAPNLAVYPWLWLWDSCFHVLIWTVLGRPDRALSELEQALSTQDGSGFVAHMGYQREPDAALELWGRSGASSITQPPMYGHAIAELVRRGVDVPDDLVLRAGRGIRFLTELRSRDRSGLIRVVHPWETGCDDSPRWDDRCPGVGFELTRWRQHKRHLVDTVTRGCHGEPLDNPEFPVAPVGFNALVAFNALELASVTGAEDLVTSASELTDALVTRWDQSLATWVDAGATEEGSGRIRTADGLLPLLVVSDAAQRVAAVETLVDPDGLGSGHGPRGVHRAEPTYDDRTYWRGPVWPQLAYLIWLGIHSSEASTAERDAAEALRVGTLRGARRSGLAEYWNGDTGEGLGAIPQSWTGLALLLDSET